MFASSRRQILSTVSISRHLFGLRVVPVWPSTRYNVPGQSHLESYTPCGHSTAIASCLSLLIKVQANKTLLGLLVLADSSRQSTPHP